MDKKVKKKWVKALRSGKYKQTQSRLQSPDGSFCCLGVLCDLEYDGHWLMKVKKIQNYWGDEIAEEKNVVLIPANGGKCLRPGEEESAVLPRKFRDKLGLSLPQHDELAEMNDEGKSFIEIADWIEENL